EVPETDTEVQLEAVLAGVEVDAGDFLDPVQPPVHAAAVDVKLAGGRPRVAAEVEVALERLDQGARVARVQQATEGVGQELVRTAAPEQLQVRAGGPEPPPPRPRPLAPDPRRPPPRGVALGVGPGQPGERRPPPAAPDPRPPLA